MKPTRLFAWKKHSTFSKQRLLAILVSGVFVTLGHAGEKLIISGHPQYPPLMWNDGGRLRGVGFKLAQTVFDELKIPYEIKLVGPWNRVQMLASQGKVDVIVALYKNDLREKYLDFSIPYFPDPTAILVKKGCSFPYRDWNSLIGKKGVTLYGESYGDEFDRFIQNDLSVDLVYDASTMLHRLKHRQQDYALFGYFASLPLPDLQKESGEIEILAPNILQQDIYMGISKKSKFQNLLPKVNKIIERLLSEGKIKQWVSEFLEISNPNPPRDKGQKREQTGAEK